jgi:hypothetical protein
MAVVSYPGVYVEEVSSGVRPIAAASTSTAAFIGQAERGSLADAVRIFNFTQFTNLYGGFLNNSYLAHSVFQFFNNGGSQCYIVRVAGENVETANIVVEDRHATPEPSLTISALSAGLWGNDIEVRITNGTNDPGNEFNLHVHFAGGADPVESFENLTMVSGVSGFVETATSGSNYIRVTVNGANTHAAQGTSTGGAAPLALPVGRARFRINVNGDGYQEVNLEAAVPAAAPDLSTAANIALAIADRVQALVPLRSSTDSDAFDLFAATVAAGGELVLTSGAAGLASSVNVAAAADPNQDASALLNLGPLNGGVETLGGAITRPVANTPAVPRYLVGDHGLPADGVVSVQAGSDGDPITNDLPYTNAFSRLDNVDDVSLISVPGIGSETVVGAGMNYCDNRSLRDCFFIGDAPQDVDTVAEAQTFVGGISPKNSFGAVYLPWLLMSDPTGTSTEPIAVPPSGFVAGIYAKTDARRGVWKAPAGTAAAIGGATGLTKKFTDVEQGLLNPSPYNLNVIRQFAASGRVIWGARTITSDPEWLYVPVRRIAIMLRVSIYRGIPWAVFEPNDEPLWSQLRLNITAFMMTLFRQGAFQGATAKDAFFVKVDGETTTQDDINNGVVNILVGFAPLKPAEFIVVKISQKAGQSS